MTDFHVCLVHRDEVESLFLSARDGDWDALTSLVELQTFDPMGSEFEQLAIVLSAATHSAEEEPELLIEDPEGEGPWITLFPTDLTRVLADVDATRIADLAEAWRTGCLPHAPSWERTWTSTDMRTELEQTLRTLVDMARRARDQGKLLVVLTTL